MRSYRHNTDRSRGAGPELCTWCGDLPARSLTLLDYGWGDLVAERLCDDCCQQLLDAIPADRRAAMRIFPLEQA